jgi:hypothetical protein
VRQYLLVSQSEALVEIYSRGADGFWRLEEVNGLDGVVSLSSLGGRWRCGRFMREYRWLSVDSHVGRNSSVLFCVSTSLRFCQGRSDDVGRACHTLFFRAAVDLRHLTPARSDVESHGFLGDIDAH